MRRHLLLITILLLAALQVTAQSMRGYEYWFDNDYDARTAVVSSQPDVSFEADISGLQAGLHYLNFRAQDANGTWGALSRFIVYMTADSRGSADMVAYEYWMDSDYDSRTVVSGTSVNSPLTVDISNLQVGLHYFNFRAQGSDGQWGALSRHIVYLTADSRGSADMVAYEYWMDSDYDSRTVVSGTSVNSPLSVDVSNLQVGLHYFNFRVQGSDGQWGALSRYIVYLSEALSNVNLSTVEYMIDNDSTTVQSQQVNGNTIVITADISRLSEGTHTINIEGITNNYTRCLLGSYEFVYDDIPRPEALFENGVLTVGGSTTMTEAVEYVGGQSVVVEKVAAVIWNSSAGLASSDLQGITNPNLLVYVNNSSQVPQGVQNVVI